MSVALRPILRAVLHDRSVFFRSGHKLLAFVNVVAERFLDVNILTGLAGPNCPQCVPMVRSGDRHRVDILVSKRLAKFAIQLRSFALGAFNKLRSLLEHLGIDIAQRDELGLIFHLENVFDM